jgi:hypothetical protein
MCRTCDDAKKLGTERGLKLIGEAMKKGKNPEHFKKTLDNMLGTDEPEVDEEKDDAFERSYRDR